MMLLRLEKLNKGVPYFLCFHEGFEAIKNAIQADFGRFYWVTKLTEMMVLPALG